MKNINQMMIKNLVERIKNSSIVPWLVTGLSLLFAGSLLLKSEPPKQWIGTSPTPTAQPNTSAQTLEQKETWRVTRVIDGDTIELEDGTRVRLLGIDTPELAQCLGQEASAAASDLLFNKHVVLETDIQLKDKYGRTLAHVFVNGTHVNEELIKAGLATVLTLPPNVKYVDKLLASQREAREAKLGIWGEEPCPTPTSTTAASGSGECTIKGNISSSGEKIYHIPGQRYYEKTKIEENKGEHWFCSEEEAVSSGWRKSKI